MELQLNQWREQLKKDEPDQEAKLAGLFLSQNHHHYSSALPLFAPDADEPTCTKLSTYSPSSATALSSYEYGRRQGVGGVRSCFSMGQWKELELQALIFRHIINGATIPPQLIHLLITNKSFILSSPSPPYYQYPPAWMQSWGKSAMDPEPGRCRRTDGKKWRCSKDAVAGHKYCDRHVHRGRNRSRKPVESPTHKPAAKPNASPAIPGSATDNNGNRGLFKSNTMSPMSAEPLTFIGGGSTSFPLSRPSNSPDVLHFNQRSVESLAETKGLSNMDSSEADKSDSQTLRHFFDDRPRAIQEPRNTMHNASVGTSLSISVPGKTPTSDVSLKLFPCIGEEAESGSGEGNGEREGSQLHWGTTWGGNQMGGPLAEALRSSSSTSSPLSVLHQLRAST